MGDLADRHRDAVARNDRQILDMIERGALAGNRPRDDVNPLIAGADRRRGHAADQRLQRLRDVLRRQPQSAGARLIDFEPQRGHFLAPVEMGVDDARVFAHHVANPRGDRAHLIGFGADDAELHGEADRRPEVETVEAHPRRAQRAAGDRRLDTRLDALARLHVLGDDDDLGKRLVGLHRQQAEPEARRALADVSGVGGDVGIARQQPLGLAGGFLRRLDRAALGEPQLEEQFRPLGEREELLLHLAELTEAEPEQQHGDADHHQRAGDAEFKRAAKGAIEARSNRSRLRRGRANRARAAAAACNPGTA